MNKNTKVLGKVLRRLRRYIPAALVSLLLATVYVVMSLYIPILVGRAIDCAIGTGQVDMDRIVAYLIEIAICTAVISLSQWTMTTIHNRITFQVIRDIRHEAFEKISTLPLSFLDSHSHGEIVSRVIADADAFGDGLGDNRLLELFVFLNRRLRFLNNRINLRTLFIKKISYFLLFCI